MQVSDRKQTVRCTIKLVLFTKDNRNLVILPYIRLIKSLCTAYFGSEHKKAVML